MAGDWIKIELTTPDKPEVFVIAETLDIDPDAVFGKLFRVWGWFDQHTENGNAPTVTKTLINRITSVAGFADAMIKAKWLIQTDAGLSIPNFDRHNGETGKKRALTAKRVAKHKSKSNAEDNKKVTQDALPREEKRREEKRTTSMSQKKFSDDDFNSAIHIFEKIKNLNPNAKKPNMKIWATDIYLMRERDKRTHDEILNVFDWANSDPFWQSNILSPAKLRKQFDQLSMKSNEASNNATHQYAHTATRREHHQQVGAYLEAELEKEERLETVRDDESCVGAEVVGSSFKQH